MAVFLAAPVVAQPSQADREFIVVCGHQAALTRASQALRRVEAEAADGPESPDLLVAVAGADGLRRVFDDREAVRAPELQDRLEVGRQSEQVNGQDGARPAADGCRNQVRIQIERIEMYIDKDWPRIEPHRRRGGREKGERRSDDLVARSYSEGHEREQDGV